MTPLEAMASGVAVVATDTGVYRSIIEPGKTGYVVEIGDNEALKQAIASITQHPERRHRMGTDAREAAVRQLSLEQEIRGYSEIYQRLWQGETFRN